VGAVGVQRVENCDSIRGARGQGVSTLVPGLIAAALTAVIREDQAELSAQLPSEARCLRNFERVREARVEEDSRSIAARVLEIGADAI
jgi:hypothetical protein